MKSVKLKSEKDLISSGFEIGPHHLSGYITLISHEHESGQPVGLPLELKRCDNLLVVPDNSITEEVYELFKQAFETRVQNEV